MNILVICNKSPYPPHDGGSLATYNLISSFGRHGHKVTLLTMRTPKHGLTPEDRAVLSARVTLFTKDVNTSFKIFPFLFNLLFSRLPYNAVRFISPAFSAELAGILNSAQFDIVQLEGLYLMPYVDTIRQHCQSKIVLRAHNVEQEIWSRIAANESAVFKKLYFTLLSKRLVWFETCALNRYDILVPITARDMGEFNRMGNSKPSFVCPAGLDIDPSLPATVISPALPSLFFLGSLDWKPNQDGLLWFIDQVFPKLRQNQAGIMLHVAGRNAPGWLERQIKVPGVLFYGEIPDARTFILSHGILVAPCFSGGGMRIKIIEAMSNRKPVVTTTIGSEGLGTTDGENILISDSVDEYVENIDRLLKFPDFYREIGTNAMDFVRMHFDNMKISADLIGFYKSQLG